MFGAHKTPLTARIRRVAEFVRAFALLEDAVERQPYRPLIDVPAAPESMIPHPHRARIVREPLRRRPGMTSTRATLCLTPLEPQPAGPMRRAQAAPRRLQSHRVGPHRS